MKKLTGCSTKITCLILCIGFTLILSRSELFAMSRLVTGSEVCEPSSRIKNVRLVAQNLTADFKVPLNYMSVKFEREGKIDSTLTLDTKYEDSSPRCQENGKISEFENSLEVQIRVTAKKNGVVDFLKQRYAKDRFKDISLEKYPNFKIRDQKNRDNKPIEAVVFRKVAVYPIDGKTLPVDYFLECDQTPDLYTLRACSLQFMHGDELFIKATFYSAHLNDWPAVYQKASAIVEKFLNH